MEKEKCKSCNYQDSCNKNTCQFIKEPVAPRIESFNKEEAIEMAKHMQKRENNHWWNNIANLLNHKLYTQYYPLTSEEDKNNFLKLNNRKIHKFIRNLDYSLRNEYLSRQSNYISKMKSTVSFLGIPKIHNIIHNRRITRDMSKDIRLNNIEKTLPKLEHLAHNLWYQEYENITIGELNYILKAMNTDKHRILLRLLTSTIIAICVGTYILLHLQQ